MHHIVRKGFLAVALISTLGLAYAAPALLSEEQLDQVSAGGQYSYVDGGAIADMGTVTVQTRTKSIERANGTTVTKAILKVKAVGTGLEAYGYGESGADGVVSAVYGEGAADQGKVVIRVKTIAIVKPDGEIITKSRVQVKVVERTIARIPTGASRSL